MRAMPEGKDRPPIPAPALHPSMRDPQSAMQIVELTRYQFRDTSEYTHEVFDYRLRWTVYSDHRSDETEGHATVSVDVWSRRDCVWNPVWTLSRRYVGGRFGSWNDLLTKLAEYATCVLL
jgi:hypothetical protein